MSNQKKTGSARNSKVSGYQVRNSINLKNNKSQPNTPSNRQQKLLKPIGKGTAEAFEIKPKETKKKKKASKKRAKEYHFKKRDSDDSALLSDVTSVISSSITEESHRILMKEP